MKVNQQIEVPEQIDPAMRELINREWAEINISGGTGGGITQAAADIRYVNETDHTKAAHDALNIDADTLDGIDSTGFAPASHVGAGGAAHANVVAGGAAGFQTGADKSKLDGIESGATKSMWTSVYLATTSALAAHTFSAGTITFTSNGLSQFDSVNLAVGKRVLVKNETGLASYKNGIYDVIDPGSVSTPTQLTRSPDADAPQDFILGKRVYVELAGYVNSGWSFEHSELPVGGTLQTSINATTDYILFRAFVPEANQTNSGAARFATITEFNAATSLLVSDPQQVQGLMTAHLANADPHTGYQKESEKNAASGYPGLGASPGTMDGTTVLYGDGVYRVPASGGYTPPWIRTGAGVHYTSWGNGDPFQVNRLLDAGLSPTRTQMVGPVSPAVLFRLPVALSVSTIYIPTLIAANANNVIYVAIYRRDTGALVTSGSMGTASVIGWSGIALSPAVALSANTDYWFAYHGSTSSNTTAIIRTPNNPFATWIYGAPAGPVADYASGIPIQVQFSVTTLGVWPDPMPAISAMAQTNRGAMLAMLEGTAS